MSFHPAGRHPMSMMRPRSSGRAVPQPVRDQILDRINRRLPHPSEQANGTGLLKTGYCTRCVSSSDVLIVPEAPNTANDQADQLALSAACADGLSVRKPLVLGLLR